MMAAPRTPQFGRGPVAKYRSWTRDQEQRLVEYCADAHFKGQPRETYLRGFAAELGGRDGNAMAARAYRLADRIEGAILARANAGEKVQAAPSPRPELTGPRAKVAALSQQGLSTKEIAAQLGEKVGTVENQLCRLRREGYLPRLRAVSTRPDMWTKRELNLVTQMRATGAKPRDIAEALNKLNGGFPVRSATSVRDVVTRLNNGESFIGAPSVGLSGADGAAASSGPSWAEIGHILRAAPVPVVPRGLTAAQASAVARGHVEFVAGRADFGPWSPRADLRLCEGLWRGESVASVAAVLGAPTFAARGRWRLIVGPWVDGRGAVPLGVSDLILPILRERAE